MSASRPRRRPAEEGEEAVSSAPAFSWYPGHMAKAMRQIEDDLRLVDLVVIVLDARIPLSSRHPQLEALMKRKGKAVVRVLNKTDLANPTVTDLWVRWFQERQEPVVKVSTLTGRGVSAIRDLVEPVRQRILAQAHKKGLQFRPTRLLVAGIPNVGKSSLINRLTHASRAKVGKKPGVTRGRQWITLAEGIELRDSPGILFPRIVDRSMFVHLAATGAIREDNLPLEEVGESLATLLEACGVLPLQAADSRLEAVARLKGMLGPGGVPDLERAAHFLLKQTREGRWGALSFETPPPAPPPVDTPANDGPQA